MTRAHITAAPARGRWVAVATFPHGADTLRLEAGGATEREARANLQTLLALYAAHIGGES